MYQRNMLVYKHSWMVIVSGFFEPAFYLLSLGIGLGAMVPEVQGVSYVAFVAPGLLASNCLNGATTDGLFNIWFKLHQQKTYDGILATPMRPADIVLGEMLWALTRGSLYAAAFLVLVWGVGAWTGEPILLSRSALAAWPAAVVVAASFSSMAICATTFVRVRQELDYVMGLVVMPMFLLSGIFFPVDQLPAWVQPVFQVVPLYHGVELLRSLTTGQGLATLWWHLLVLVAAAVLALWVAIGRLERTLLR